MSKVFVLPDHIASQIAAGEVIDRPASVVKELVENSLDAGATQIEISISADCRDIRVADNGCGMAPEDAVLAFHRHATSKLRSADDLWNLQSLGFRGEAIPSIASISHLTCLTRSKDADTGTRVEAKDGKVTAVETGCAPGTVMEVVDLFFNVPARLKFLKKASTEFGHIHETVQSLAIAFPQISFKLLHEDEVVLRTSGSGDLSQAIVEAGHFSGEESLSAVDYKDDKSDILVRGFIARPLHFRGDRKGILAIVNNRPVRCPLTYKALEYAYSDLIPRGKHPLAVVSVNLGANQVDVNVHPTKKEIKYSSGNDVYVTIQRALIESLRNAAWKDNARVSESSEEQIDFAPEPRVASITYVESDFANDAAGAQAPESGFDRTQKQLGFRNRLYYRPAITESSQSYPDSFINENRPVQPTLPASWRLLGYLLHTYILVETPDGLEVIEQHIAHERTLYERFLEMQKTKGRTADGAQRLLISASLKLTSEQKALVKQNLELLQSFGFDFEFSSDSKEDVICTQVPLELAHKNYSVAVQEIIEQLSVTDNANMSLEATKSLACQAAIKNGMPLSEDDILRLISDWYTTPRNDTCPHGRPVRLRFSMEKLFQLFHPA